MDEKTEPAVDLLGDPWTEARDPRGRKQHRRSKEIAENVAVLRAAGSTIEEIAARLVLDPKTLQKYYSRELREGPSRARQVLVETMWAKAREGNVSAAKFIRDELARGEAQAAREQVERRADPPKPDKLGKKAEAQQAAEKVGGKYAPPAAPVIH